MKRVFTIMFALMVGLSARAQLNVTSEASEPVKIAAANYGFGCFLFESPKIGYFLYLLSSNRYDKKLYFILGEELDGAIKTLEDMRGLCDSFNDRILTVQASPKRSCSIMASDKAGWLRLRLEYQAGYSELRDKDLDLFIKELKARQPAEGDGNNQ